MCANGRCVLARVSPTRSAPLHGTGPLQLAHVSLPLVYLQWCMAEIEYFLQTKTKVLTARNGSSAPRDKAAAKVSKAN
jgi:hypothetical protein